MKKTDNYEKRLISIFVNTIIVVLKWMTLIACVGLAGMTVAFFVMAIIRNSSLSNENVATMLGMITDYTENDIFGFIRHVGKGKVLVGCIGYGFTLSFSFALSYILFSRFQVIFKSIISGDMFTKDNVELINSSVPITFMAAFTEPILIYCMMFSTKLFDTSYIDVSGIIYIIIAIILKLIFERGYELMLNNTRYDKELSDMKAKENEKTLTSLKREVTKKKKTKEEVKTTKKKTTNK